MSTGLLPFVVVSQTSANALEAENTSLLAGTSFEAIVATSKLIPLVLRHVSYVI